VRIPFVKYQGTGNDFIIIDAREIAPVLDVQKLCDRHFGIGADGLMLLKDHPEYDFEMVYYNSDGNLSTMCGNGGRCLSHFAHQLGIGNGNLRFIAVDGPHEAKIQDNWVALGMIDVPKWDKRSQDLVVIHTGSPHYVQFMEHAVEDVNLIEFARSIRYNDEFGKEGINVNIVNLLHDGSLKMRTYERGVEDETMSCGTGVTAAALSAHITGRISDHSVAVHTAGGDLSVQFSAASAGFAEVVLSGPAEAVFQGFIEA